MLYREIMAVCSQIHTKHINTLCGQNVELLNVKLAVHIVTTGLQRVNLLRLSVPDLPVQSSRPVCLKLEETKSTWKTWEQKRSWYQKLTSSSSSSSSSPSTAAVKPSVGFGFLQNPPRADIKIGIKKTELTSLNWIHLAEDWAFAAVVSTAMNLRFS